LAQKKLERRKETIHRLTQGLEVLESVIVHPVFGKEENTLGDFFDKREISQAREMCEKTNDEFERRITELKRTMEGFISQGEGLKREFLDWEPEVIQDGGQVHEITLIADKIERGISLYIETNLDFTHISEMTNVHTASSASTRSFQNHTREYIPNIQNASTSLLRNLESAYKRRNAVSMQSQTYLQRLSIAQERMVSIGPRLAEADDFFTSSQKSFDLLQEVETLAKQYGEGLLEGFRRGLWKVRRAKKIERARQEIALLRAHERQARKAWGEVSSDANGVIWGFMEELSEDEDTSASMNGVAEDSDSSPVSRKDIEKYISTISKAPLFETAEQSLKDHLSVLLISIQAQNDVGTSPLRQDSSDGELPPFKTREGSEIYEQLLQDKTRAEERARNFESRVKNLEEMLHRQFRTPPRHFTPIPTNTTTTLQHRTDLFDEPLLGGSVIRTQSPELTKRIQDLEREKSELLDRINDTERTKNDLLANLEEQTKLFQVEREDLVRKQHGLERDLERREQEITTYDKMEEEMELLKRGKQTLLREMNLLQTESGAKIKELEDAKNFAENRVSELEKDGESAAADVERITGEWKKASSAVDDANVELEKFRRLSDEHKAEHDRLEQLEKELQAAQEKIKEIEEEKKAAVEDQSTAVNAIRYELSTLRDRIVDILGLEKRRWETESLLHAISQKLAAKDQRVIDVIPLHTLLILVRRNNRLPYQRNQIPFLTIIKI
jgi:DNA repair exonuclease SbcCD ATPase subunit